MKRLLTFLATLSTVVSFILYFFLNYNFIVIAYHLLVISIVYLFILISNVCLVNVGPNGPIKSFIINFVNGLFYLSIIQFYLLVLGSNFLWSKTITLPILRNYMFSLTELLLIIPVEKWIVAGLLLFYLCSLFILFLFIRPKPTRLYETFMILKKRNFLKRTVLIIASVSICILLFNKQLWWIKRKVHFAEEPLMEFTLGEMWGKENTLAFDNKRYENGLKDKDCIDSIKLNTKSGRTIILILVDALRSDHLPVYGYPRQTMPFVDSLYRQNKLSVVRNAFSTSTMTIGGISGLFFSKGWTDFGFNGLSLMKFMKKSGFNTYAFLTGFHRDWYGLSALYRGNCDFYYESSKNPEIQNDDDLLTLKEIEKTPIKENSFVYIHLLSVHMLGKRNEPFRKFLPDKIGLSTDQRTALINNYDNGILQADYVIEKVFQTLKRQNRLKNSTIYILSDHGELFGEDNSWRHGGNIHEKLISIPLLIYDEDTSWYQNLESATLKDIAPTIANRIGSPVPSCWEGHSLHKPASDFETEINSVEECSLPYGNLSKSGNVYRLTIMNNKKEVKKVIEKRLDIWNPVAK